MKKKVLFKYNSGNILTSDTHIFLAGTFNDWNETSIPVDLVDGVTLDLDCGVYEFKFIVNGKWLLSEGAPIVLSSSGDRNNVVHVTENERNDIDILHHSTRVCFRFESYQLHFYSTSAAQQFRNYNPCCFVVGEFNDWKTDASKMTMSSYGYYYRTRLYPGIYKYKYYAEGAYYNDYGSRDYLCNWFLKDSTPLEEDDDYRYTTHIINVPLSDHEIIV